MRHCFLRLSCRVRSFATSAAITASAVFSVVGAFSVALCCQDEIDIILASGSGMTRIHQLKRLICYETDIYFADAAHRAIFLLFRPFAAQRDMERTQSVNLHLVALGKRQA